MVIRGHRAVAPILLAMFVTLLFGTSIFYGFAYDDHAILVSNLVLGDWGTIWEALTSDLFHNSSVRTSPFWRPLVTLSYYVDASIDRSPMQGHVTNLVLAWLMSWSFYRLMISAGYTLGLSLAGTLLLLCHPVVVEPIVNITSRTDLMAATFALLALNSRRSLPVIMFVLFALWSKEVAIVLPLMFLALERPKEAKLSIYGVGIFLVLRTIVSALGGLGDVSLSGEQLMAAGATFWLQISFLLFPGTSTLGQTMPTVGLIGSVSGWLAVSILVGLIGYFWSATPKLVRLAGVTIVPTIMLVSGITGSSVRVGDGLLLFPLIGLVWLILNAVVMANRRTQAAVMACLIGLSIWSGSGTANNWRDDLSLWQAAYDDLPGDPLIQLNYARSIVETRPDEVLPLLSSFENGDPRKQRESSEILARAFINLNDQSGAVPYLLAARGDDVEAQWANSTACLVTTNLLIEDADSVCEAAFATDPVDGGLRNSLGVYYGRKGEHALALTQFEMAVVLAPDELSYSSNLRSARALAGE